MALHELQPGDIVYATTEIFNDGSVPHLESGVSLATVGTRGVILNTGHLEEQPDKELYLIRFEDENRELGPPIGCWPEELSDQPL
ncbi:MAG: nitrogen fixation protein NifZ [Granulosicoccaceae bacterium]